jgi:hypothetical protein
MIFFPSIVDPDSLNSDPDKDTDPDPAFQVNPDQFRFGSNPNLGF